MPTSTVESLPIGRCTVQAGGILSCSQVTDTSCSHSMDLGVVCQTECEQRFNELQDQCSMTTGDSQPTSPTEEITSSLTPKPCECLSTEDSTTVTHPSVTTKSCDCPSTEDSTHPPVTTESCDCPPHTTPASFPHSCDQTYYNTSKISGNSGTKNTVEFGAVTGVLVAVIVAMGIGWVCTCVIVKRHMSVRPKEW